MKSILLRVARIAGNGYWKIFGGVVLCVIWFALGFAAAITVVGAPWAARFFKAGMFVWKPFGKQIVIVPSSPVSGILWAATGGVLFGIISLVGALISFASLAAIPLAYQWLKVAVVSVFPFSCRIS